MISVYSRTPHNPYPSVDELWTGADKAMWIRLVLSCNGTFHFIFPGSLSIHGGNHENSQHRSLSDQALDHGLVLALIPIPEDRVLKGSNAGGNSYLCVTKPWRHINRDYKIIVEL